MAPGKLRKFKEISPSNMAGSKSSKWLLYSKPPAPSQNAIKLSLDRLHTLWEEKRVEGQFKEEFLRATDKLALSKLSAAVSNEIEELLDDASASQLILKNVATREDSLEYLLKVQYRELDSLQTRQVALKALNEYRYVSLEIVENIQKWKETLSSYNPSYRANKLIYLYKGENYLLKLGRDTEALASCCIGDFIEITSKSDVFLVSASTPMKPNRTELPVPLGLMKRIKAAEIVVLEEMRLKNIVRESPFQLRNKKHRIISEPDQQEDRIELVSPDNLTIELKEYSRKVPVSLSETFGSPETAVKSSLAMKYPAYLWIHINGSPEGFLVLNLETQKTLQRRLHITHISSTSLDLFPKILSFCLNYIWVNYPCLEIRVGLVASKNPRGKFETDKEIKQFFDSVGFRWKQFLCGSESSTPLQLLGLRRPEDSECNNTNTEQLFSDSIELAYACIMQVDITADSVYKEKTVNYPYSMIGSAFALKILGSEHSPEHPLSRNVKNLVGKIRENWVPPAFRLRKEESVEAAMKDLESQRLNVAQLEEALETAVSCFSLGLSWKKYLTGNIGPMLYTKVFDSEISVMCSENKDIYIVPTEDPGFNTFFIPCKEKVPEGDIFSYGKEILSKISELKEIRNEIWIPEFSLNQDQKLGNFVGESVGEKTITHCEEKVLCVISACKHPLGALELHPQKNELILEAPFLFGLINAKVDEELELPYLVLYIK